MIPLILCKFEFLNPTLLKSHVFESISFIIVSQNMGIVTYSIFFALVFQLLTTYTLKTRRRAYVAKI